jgi:hypothetical protein
MTKKVFVSSTYLDLKDHRAKVIKSIRESGFFVDPMEHWTCASQEPCQLSTKRLEGCVLCILLVARRIGYVPSGQTLSITQQEVEGAERLQIPVLVFLLDDAVPDGDWQWEDRELAETWRSSLAKRYTVSSFGVDPNSIEISPALTRWSEDNSHNERLNEYLKLVAQEHGKIHFVGLPRVKDLPNEAIYRLYVEPLVSYERISPDTPAGDWTGVESVLESLRKHPRLVMLGDPGTGKSTLIDWISYQLSQIAGRGDNTWGVSLGQLIPIPIILRELSLRADVTWDQIIQEFLKSPLGTALGSDSLYRICRDGKALIMLDGLDEIGSTSLRTGIRKAIWDAFRSTAYQRCRFLMTSRIVGYSDVPFHFETYNRFGMWNEDERRADLAYVAPFSDQQIDIFAEKWFITRDEPRKTVDEFLSAIRAHDSTVKLARIPNMLTIMALIFRGILELPDGRSLLYGHISQAYLV